MYSPELLELVEMALMDGELSQKEREIILRKAEKLGEDPDEVEMWLEGKLQKKKREIQATIPPLQNTEQVQKKSDKFGEMKKCPACGAVVSSFSSKCSDCGHEFSNIEANVSIQKLFKMLNDVENHRKDESDNPLNAIGNTFARAFAGSSHDNSDKKKIEIISNFPIPTTKDDILEFLSLALPKAKTLGNFLTKNNPENKIHNDFAQVWKTKCEQIIMKARFSMKEDKNTLEEINNYAKELGIK